MTSPKPEKVKRAVPAVTRAVAILRRLGASDDPLGVQQIARDLGLVPSTCLHILRVLTDEGLVAFDESTKRYSIDVGILSIARSAIEKNAFASLIQPRLDMLTTEFGLTTIATKLVEPASMVVVALSHVQLPFRLQVDMGSRFPALISATGRCFAAFNGLDEGALKRGFKKLQWDNPPEYDQWRREVDAARETGFGVDRGNYIAGVTVMAVPFLNDQNVMVNGMVAIGISDRVETIGSENLARAMLGVRDEIAPMLFPEMS